MPNASKYKALYEESINPFTVFTQKQRALRKDKMVCARACARVSVCEQSSCTPAFTCLHARMQERPRASPLAASHHRLLMEYMASRLAHCTRTGAAGTGDARGGADVPRQQDCAEVVVFLHARHALSRLHYPIPVCLHLCALFFLFSFSFFSSSSPSTGVSPRVCSFEADAASVQRGGKLCVPVRVLSPVYQGTRGGRLCVCECGSEEHARVWRRMAEPCAVSAVMRGIMVQCGCRRRAGC